MFIVDSHCHLDALDYENLHKDIADVVSKAQSPPPITLPALTLANDT